MEDVTLELALFTLGLKMISVSFPHHHDTEIVIYFWMLNFLFLILILF